MAFSTATRKRKVERYDRPTTDISGFQVLQRKEVLESLWNQAKITSIHNMEQGFLGSGSKVTQKQFIALRVIFPVLRKADELDEEDAHKDTYGLLSEWKKAIALVQGCPEFQAYFQLISDNVRVITINKSESRWPGTLKPARLMQEQISKANTVIPEQKRSFEDTESRSRTRQSTKVAKLVEAQYTKRFVRSKPSLRRKWGAKTSQASSISDSSDESSESHDSDESYFDPTEFPEARNEVTTTAALILLLQEVSSLTSRSTLEWDLNPVHFRCKFGGKNFNVHTDGALRSITSGKVLSIVETKRRARFRGEIDIQMKEGAEMVGWLLNEDKKLRQLNGHRVLVSQDAHCIYVIFASYSDEYVDYLKNRGPATRNAFLTMQAYGPMDVRKVADMKRFSILMAAVMLAFEPAEYK